jgi:hypothetical protein
MRLPRRFPWCTLASPDGNDRTPIWPDCSEILIGRKNAPHWLAVDSEPEVSRCHCAIRRVAPSESESITGPEAMPGGGSSSGGGDSSSRSSSSGGSSGGDGGSGTRAILADLSTNGMQVNGRPVPQQDRPPPEPHPPAVEPQTVQEDRAAPGGSGAGGGGAGGAGAGPWRWVELRSGDRIALLLKGGMERHVFNVSLA